MAPYVIEALFLLMVLSWTNDYLFALGFWMVMGMAFGVSASERRGYPLRRFVRIGAVLGPLACVLYLAPRGLPCGLCRRPLSQTALGCEACGWERYPARENPPMRRPPARPLPFRPTRPTTE